MIGNIENSIELKEILETYIELRRPAPEIRKLVDLGYQVIGQSIILYEVRPSFLNPNEIQNIGYAKATYVKSKNIWKVFWKRSDLKWHSYKKNTAVNDIQQFLKLVDVDEYRCFKG